MTSWLFIFLSFFTPIFTQAQTEVKAAHSHLRIFTRQQAIQSGDLLDVGFDFSLEPGWHIYWLNPGDSGTAPTVELQGGTLVKWRWPSPERIPLPPLANYGYEARVVFPVTLRPDPNVRSLDLRFEWLVCRVECVPVIKTLKLTVPWAEKRIDRPRDAAESILWDDAVRQVPRESDVLQIRVDGVDEKELRLRLSGLDLLAATQAMIFPQTEGIFKTEMPAMELRDTDLLVRLPFRSTRDPAVSEVKLTTVLRSPLEQKAFDHTVVLRESPPVLGRLLLLAFLGGLLLNLMPCVFPVLSLKVFQILKEDRPQMMRRSGWFYTAGVLVSFLILGLALVGLRSGAFGWSGQGQDWGWGFQLQSPVFVYLSALLFFILALNFLDFFEWGNGIASKAGTWGQKKQLSGSFGTGVLAVFVASPCTAPFMGAALGATLFLPVAESLAVFLCLGLGLAFPVLILGYIPGVGRLLPRPGKWMQLFKQFMAFPMLVTSVWLIWVFSRQVGDVGLFKGLLGLVAVGFVVWALQQTRSTVLRIVWLLSLGVALGGFLMSLRELNSPRASLGGAEDPAAEWQKFSPARIEAERGKRAIFIDFTASWCITCQVNKMTVLRTEKARKLFREHQVLLLEADWTDRDPLIAQTLKSFGRNSVPLYVYYDSAGKAQVLPEILTMDMIERLWRAP